MRHDDGTAKPAYALAALVALVYVVGWSAPYRWLVAAAVTVVILVGWFAAVAADLLGVPAGSYWRYRRQRRELRRALRMRRPG